MQSVRRVMTFAYVLVFGFFGVSLRYGLNLLVREHWQNFFPQGVPIDTFAINIVGALLIGICYALAEKAILAPEIKTALFVGFLGGFTTFSAYCMETVQLLEKSSYGLAAFYWLLSPILGLLACLAGVILTRRLF